MRISLVAGMLIGTPVAALGAVAMLVARRLTRRPPPDPVASPEEYGLPWENVAFLTNDSITLRGWFIPCQPGPARGTIIFCHGHNGSMDPDLQYAPAFHHHGYNVLMFDFRSHGRSDGNLVSLGYYERRDVLAAIRFLKQRGIERVGLLGFSLGGAVAISTAPLSSAVQAVISDSGFAAFDTVIIGWLKQKGAPELPAACLARLIVRCIGMRLGHPLSEAYPINWVDRIAPRSLFLIHGAEDTLTPASEARRLYARAGEPKELWVVPGAGHREIDAAVGETYTSRILEFFDRVFPGGSSVEESR